MLHQRINANGDHWGVSHNALEPETVQHLRASGIEPEMGVLVQLQELGEQVRVRMSPEHAEHMAAELVRMAALVRATIAAAR
jgi:hypothetical protein